MARKGPHTLIKAVTALYPDILEPAKAIEGGQISVDGRVIRNPASVVGAGSRIAVVHASTLRGESKLRAALNNFKVRIEDRVALDAGAAAGGFTRVLLECGAARVYAVDAGHGQLLGSLRQDARVVNLEATNLAALTPELVADEIEVITLDLSYLSLVDAVPQLERVLIAEDADLLTLVKPMFELHLPRPPHDRQTLEAARERAIEGIDAAGWIVVGSMESPVTGARGAAEFLLHAIRGEGPESFHPPFMSRSVH